MGVYQFLIICIKTQGDDFTRSYDNHLNNGFADAEELVRDFACYQVRGDWQLARF